MTITVGKRYLRFDGIIREVLSIIDGKVNFLWWNPLNPNDVPKRGASKLSDFESFTEKEL